jgi:solute carrier family 25 iron transporter 28/37
MSDNTVVTVMDDEMLSLSPQELTTSLLSTAFLGGAVAGTTEHLVMYPVDTVKTRMQVGMPQYSSVPQAASMIFKEGGPKAFYRGLPAVLLGAIPSHAACFTSLEATRVFLSQFTGDSKHPLVSAVAGAVGVTAHDFIATPLDVVKQRLVCSFICFCEMRF